MPADTPTANALYDDLACDVCGSPYARHAHIDRGTSIRFAKAALCPDHFRGAVKAWEQWILQQKQNVAREDRG